MALDPKKFALLTSAIAASIVVAGASSTGCSDAASDDEGDSGTGSSGEVTSSSGGGSSGGGSSSGGSSSSGGGTSSSSGGREDAGPDGGGCLGDEGAAPTCDDLGTGCLASDDRDYMCPGFASFFKPSVARATLDCLKISPSCEEERDFGAPECAIAAVADACTNDDAATVQAFCDDVLLKAECEDADLATQCKAFYPALTQAGQDGLKACALDSSGCGLFEYCLDPTYASSTLVTPTVD